MSYDPNLPRGLSRRDLDYIEGRHFTNFEDAEQRGVAWMRSLTLPGHAAYPFALNPTGSIFRAACRCGWEGDVRSAFGVGSLAKARAQADADLHNKENGAAAN